MYSDSLNSVFMKRTYLTSHISTNDDEIKITSFHHFAIIWGKVFCILLSSGERSGSDKEENGCVLPVKIHQNQFIMSSPLVINQVHFDVFIT